MKVASAVRRMRESERARYVKKSITTAVGRWGPMLVALCVIVGRTAPVWAQRPVYEGAISGGSGVSFGNGDDYTVVMMSPAYLDVDVIFYNDERPRVEWVMGFQMELQGRVSVGVVPQVRINTGQTESMWYGLVGAPLVFAPFVLFGIEVGAGYLWRFTETTGVFAELVSDMFFLGSDIVENGVLVQVDMNLGVRMRF